MDWRTSPRIRFVAALSPLWLSAVVAVVVMYTIGWFLYLIPNIEDIAANPDGHAWVSMWISLQMMLYYFVFEYGYGLVALSIPMTIIGLAFSYVPALRTRVVFVLLALLIGLGVPLFISGRILVSPSLLIIIGLIAVLSYFFGPYSSTDAAAKT
jgi:hypothetical protein